MDKKSGWRWQFLSLGGCRIVSQQELADLKSPPNPHMANIDQTWQKNIVPQVVENARPVAELMAALQAKKMSMLPVKRWAIVLRKKTRVFSTLRSKVASPILMRNPVAEK